MISDALRLRAALSNDDGLYIGYSANLRPQIHASTWKAVHLQLLPGPMEADLL